MKLPCPSNAPSQGDWHGVNEAELAFWRAAEAPVIFQRHDHAALFGFGNAFFDALDAPFETIVLRAAGDDGLDAARFHQVIEILDGVQRPELRRMARHTSS